MIQSEILPSPVHVGDSVLQLSLSDPSAKPVSGAQISIEGDMSHPGMAPVFFSSAETEPGHYRSSLKLSMPGDWTILLHIRLADGTNVERQVEVPGVLPN